MDVSGKAAIVLIMDFVIIECKMQNKEIEIF